MRIAKLAETILAILRSELLINPLTNQLALSEH